MSRQFKSCRVHLASSKETSETLAGCIHHGRMRIQMQQQSWPPQARGRRINCSCSGTTVKTAASEACFGSCEACSSLNRRLESTVSRQKPATGAGSATKFKTRAIWRMNAIQLLHAQCISADISGGIRRTDKRRSSNFLEEA